jgi:hydrogenase nickel incorporation protein HypB
MALNDETAAANRKHMEAMETVSVNIISGPGSGKTTLLEKTIDILGDDLNIGILEGDIETDLDGDRLRAKGVPVVQLTTGGACHLDSALVHSGLHEMNHILRGDKLDILFIENVGNLVCPASFYLGEHVRVVMVSVPEGADKPAKYPTAFRTSHVFVISKTDLMPYFDFSTGKATEEAVRHNPSIEVMAVSAVSGEGLERWISFLRKLVGRPASV